MTLEAVKEQGMITTCTECQARYQLEDQKVPHRVIKVRCPECQGVFPLDGTVLDKAASTLVVDHGNQDFAPTPAAVPKAAKVQTQAAPAAAKSGVAVLDEPAPSSTPVRSRRRKSKEEMYARALVSDILAYNREARDSALQNGNLVEALGAEIKKSWELYKEKVTPEVANSTDHFRNALNEILAGGKNLF